MYAAQQALSAYQSVGTHGSVTDASPHQLITLLLEGAMSRIASAKGAVSRGEFAQQGELIGKSISIVDSLRASLDAQRGGEVAKTLEELYNYILQRLVEANQSSSTAALDEARDLLSTVHEAWISLPQAGR